MGEKIERGLDGQRRRVSLMLAALILGGFIATILISYRVAHDSLSDRLAEDTLPLTSDNIYSEIQRDLLRPIFISSLMAQDTFLRDWALGGEKNPGKIVRYLSEIQQRYGTITSFFASDRTRNYYHYSGVLRKISEQEPLDTWFFRVRRLPSGEDYEINIDHDTADLNRTTVFINHLVHDYNGRFIGVTGVGLALDSVKHLVERYEKRYGRRVFFVDQQGNTTLRSANLVGETNLRNMPGIGPLATRILTTPSGNFSYKHKGRTVYLSSRLVPEFKWYLMVEQEDDPAERRLVFTLVVNLILALAVTGLVLLLAHFTFRGYQRRLEEMASTDKLTGTTNRQVFEEMFARVLRVAIRSKHPVSVVMFDIDHFKQINDSHGHIEGDRILKTITQGVRRQMRGSDTLCRWGGEEFVMLLPDCDLEHACETAERLRRAIQDHRIGRISVTISLGVAQHENGDTIDSLIDRADQAMYLAKAQGRNRVECQKMEPPQPGIERDSR